MSEDEWGRPAEVSGEYARPALLSGHLLIIFPLGYVTGIQTKFGLKDGVTVDVVDLDDKDEQGNPGKVYRSSNFMQGKLIAGLKGQIDKKVLGVMGQDTAKQGMSPAWVVIDMSADPRARSRADAWKDANPGFRPSTFTPWEPRAQEQSQPQQQRPQQQYSQPEQRYSPSPQQQPQQTQPQRFPVQGSSEMSVEEKSIIEQFRQRRAQAQGFPDEAPF